MINMKIKLLETNNKQTGPGFWKCNINTLKDKHFQEDFDILWDKLNKIVNQNGEWWEECKRRFKQLIILHSTRLNIIRREKLKKARKKLDKLLHHNPNTQVNNGSQITSLQSEIELIYNEEMEGCKLRAKENYLETNETPTRYFFKEGKTTRLTQKSIKRLIKVDKSYAESNPEIMDECVNFYQKLYNIINKILMNS